ncbi:MAG: hypothetical protein R2759_11125 [Bacteroidales bacterium]
MTEKANRKLIGQLIQSKIREVSPSKKYIYLRNFPYPDIIEKQVNLDSSFLRDVRDTVVTVKNKNKLMYMELEFVRLKP